MERLARLYDTVAPQAGELELLLARMNEVSDPDSDLIARALRARVILDSMYQFVGLLDLDGTLLETNTTALEAGGLARADVIGRLLWEARWWRVSPETLRDLARAIDQAAAGQLVRYDVDVLAGAGGSELVTIDFNVRPVLDSSGRPRLLVVEGRDITEKKRAEQAVARQNTELRALAAQLSEADERRRDFIANVTHELKTPLSIVLGLAARLLDSPGLLPAARRDVNGIRTNTMMVVKQVEDLLHVARLDSDAVELHPRPVDVSALIRRVGATFESLAQERGIDLIVEVPQAVPARVDDDKLVTVVTNLVANAVKFTPARGVVRLSLRTSDKLEIAVADSGPGVPPGLRDVVFERFRQADGGTSRRFGGTGLGLAIARELVELHGGQIGVGDALEGGAEFKVELPYLRAETVEVVADEPIDVAEREQPTLERLRGELAAAARRESQPTLDRLRGELAAAARRESHFYEGHGAQAPGATVLVVEDNAALAEFLDELLGSMYTVAHAADGEQALRQIEEHRPDLILTDLMVPGMSGADLVAAVRSRPELDDVPIVVLSARSDEELRLSFLREGAQDYLQKPFAGEELLARVGNLISRRQAEFAQRQAQTRFRAAFDNAPIGMALADVSGRYLKVNRAFCAMTGYAESELMGRTFADVTHPEDVDLDAEAMESLVEGTLPAYQIEKRYLRAGGSVAWVSVSTSLLPADDQDRPTLIVQIEDISERKRLEQELSHVASRDADHDPLTGLLNRRGFEELLSAQVERSQRYGETAVLCRVHLGGLEAAARTHGRQGAEALLIATSGGLRSRMRGSDLVGRLDDDEFAVLAVHVAPDAAESVREAIARTVAVETEFEGARLQADPAVGWSVIDGSADAETVLAAARRAPARQTQ